MREPTEQQLNAALAGWIERLERGSKIALASVRLPDLDAQDQETLRQAVASLETSRKKLNDACLALASTVASIPWPQQCEKMAQSLTHIAAVLSAVGDRALNEEAESRAERHDWLGRVRSRYKKSAQE